jgi:alpha-L-arabinofuranosidase
MSRKLVVMLLSGAALIVGARAQSPNTTAERISVSIDASKTAAPISPYIYGQFIEHIADTVNRSLWAEMLDDRKFFSDINSKPVPERPGRGGQGPGRGRGANLWRPIGPDESVTMDRGQAYSGQHSPLIKLDGAAPRGIAQAGIVLRNDRAYSGRVVLAGDPEANVTVSLVWGSGPNDRQTIPIQGLRSDYAKFPLKFTALADADNGRIEIAGTGKGAFHVGAVSLMPADNIRGFRTDTTLLLRQLRTGMWRFPGGNFISAYEWRDTIGDIDKRPPRWDPVWNALQPNDVGVDEWLFMMELLGVEPYLNVSAGFGDAHSAADAVEYVNGSIDTPMGKLRAANGHPEPYGVKWWGIGNEMWGDFQFGYMALKQYVYKHNQFGEAMRKVDPAIFLTATGRAGETTDQVGGDNDFTAGLLTHCLPYIDAVSEHYYANDGRPRANPNQAQNRAAPPEIPLIDSVYRAADVVRAKVEAYQEYYRRIPGLQNKKVPMAIDEWAYTGGGRGNLKETLANALVFHEMFRHTDIIIMAAHTMGTSSIDFNMNDAALNTTGLLFKLYRDHMGTIPVEVGGNSPAPAPASAARGRLPKEHGSSPTWPVDVSAALSADGKLLTIAVVNANESAKDFDLTIRGAQLTGKGRMWRLTGPNLDAMTSLTRKEVQVTESPVTDTPKVLKIAPISIDIYEFEKQ